ncbi:MAG: Sir2 family NAD-dependent protein deacetylase [Planctomycetes bacterium]|nr:Sir2 family NAD-dependent protein deacetylase [Planctomycetota bacterium]
MQTDAETIARWLTGANSVVAFSGAGISTESGIPDYRSPNGVWSKSQPVYFDDYLRSEESRKEYWRQKSQTHLDFMKAVPNVAHIALARWEQTGLLRGVITQNIDGLHHVAGSRNVLELHGTAREISCLDCEARFDADPMVTQFNETGTVPCCPKCGGITKHATISFGQSLSPDVLQEAIDWSRAADLFLAMGSSLVVEPAAGLPRIAKQNGCKLVIINRDATPLDPMADLVIHASIGETFSQIEDSL